MLEYTIPQKKVVKKAAKKKSVPKKED